MAASLEIARQEWEVAHDALHSFATSDRVRYERLLAQVEVATEELRKHVGQTFTLDQLARAYADADRWIRAAVEDRAATPGWARDLALVQDAAFHLYQRGATDYAP